MPTHATPQQAAPTTNPIERLLVAVVAALGIGANAALALALVTFLYVLTMLL